jgi:hypothetical protein
MLVLRKAAERDSFFVIPSLPFATKFCAAQLTSQIAESANPSPSVFPRPTLKCAVSVSFFAHVSD